MKKVKKRFNCQNRSNIGFLNINIKISFLIHTASYFMNGNVYYFSKQMRGFPVCDIA